MFYIYSASAIIPTDYGSRGVPLGNYKTKDLAQKKIDSVKHFSEHKNATFHIEEIMVLE